MQYRKDAKPEDTIRNIYKILKDMNINTKISNEISYKNIWFSLTIELENYPFICTNGKGCTRELALASGLAEFMERLQSGFLLNEIKPKDKAIYTNLCTGKQHIFSNDTLNIICGSNGLAAGNSKNEAICQGTFEILERHALKNFFFNSSQLKTGGFAIETFNTTTAYTILQELQELGYIVKIIDATQSGTLPVLGIMIINPHNHTYFYSFASDFDIDICLQRCITELFQGRIISPAILKMQNYWHPLLFSEHQYNSLAEFYKQLSTSQGKLSVEVLNKILNFDGNKKNLHIFKGISSNEECYNYLLSYCTQNNITIYAKNLSLSPFSTFRIYIPGMSEVYVQNQDNIPNIKNNLAKIKSTLMQIGTKKINIEKLKNDIENLSYYDIYQFQFPLFKMLPYGWNIHNELITTDIMKILSIICLYQKDLSAAYFYAQKSLLTNPDRHTEFIMWYIKMKLCNPNKEIKFWHNETVGISKSIKELENIYKNCTKLIFKE